MSLCALYLITDPSRVYAFYYYNIAVHFRCFVDFNFKYKDNCIIIIKIIMDEDILRTI